MSDFGFFIFLAVMIIFFEGDPDLHDALMAKLSGDCITQVQEGDADALPPEYRQPEGEE